MRDPLLSHEYMASVSVVTAGLEHIVDDRLTENNIKALKFSPRPGHSNSKNVPKQNEI